MALGQLGGVGRSKNLTAIIKAMFANGEQGWWYDPSNLSTLFQDSAGTTPVTAMEQPVGLQLDLSGRGNHRRQTTSANRPVVSARVNLLTKTEEFDNAAWTKSSLTVISNSIAAPNGSVTADTIRADGVTCRIFQLTTLATGVSHRFAAYIKAGLTLWVAIRAVGSATQPGAWFNLGTGVVGTVESGLTATITPAGNGWFLCEITFSAITAAATNFSIYPVSNNGNYASAVNDTLYIWGADLRPTNQGVGLPAYQRVNTSTDYDSTGFPVYIKPNGSNQFMQTNSINFSSTDKMTLWAGLRNLSNLACIFAETSTSAAINLGTFYIVTGTDAGGTGYSSLGHGTAPASTLQTAKAFTFIAPDTAVISITHNIANDLSTIRRNTVDGTNAIGDKGTGNFGNYPAYFYMRAGTSLPFNGNDYGSIARGAASTAAQIASGETYINSKTKAY